MDSGKKGEIREYRGNKRFRGNRKRNEKENFENGNISVSTNAFALLQLGSVQAFNKWEFKGQRVNRENCGYRQNWVNWDYMENREGRKGVENISEWNVWTIGK